MDAMLREGQTLAPSARTLWEIQACACRLPVETASNLYTDVLRRRASAAAIGEARRSAVRSVSALHAYQAEVRRLFLDCIGGLPDAPPTPVHRLTGRVDCGAYAIEKLLLAPREGTWLSANVYVPAHGVDRHPAVLVTVGHDDRGKADPEYQYLAHQLVMSGFVVLVFDPLGQGERFEHYETALDFQPIQGCSGEHDLLDWKAKLLGRSLAGYFIQDGLCALDYLAARDDVDASRIGLTGHSGGGTQVSLLLMVAGERFACAAPCAYFTDARAMMEHGIDPDNEMLWPGSLAAGLDYIDFAAGIAPRPLLLLTNQHDFFPREGTLRMLSQARELWKAVGSDVLPEIATADSQHAYPASLARAAMEFFLRHIGGQAAPEDTPFQPRAPQELQCTPDGQLLRYDLHMRTVHDDLADALPRLRTMRNALSAEARHDALIRRLHVDALDKTPEPRVFAEGICGQMQYRCLLWRPQEGYWNSGVLLRDFRQGDKPLPTVIALWPEGNARLTEHSAWLHRCLRRGWQVLVMDVAASGALLPARLGSTDLYAGWSTLYNLNAYLIQLNDSLFAMRTRQVIAAVRMLRAFAEADASHLLLYAEKEFSRYASLASLLTDTPVHADDDCQPYEEIVRERYHDQTWTHAWVFPGVLRLFDTPELHSSLMQQGLIQPDPADTTPSSF